MIDKALLNLRPGAAWSLDGSDKIIWEDILVDGIFTGQYRPVNLVWLDKNQSCPSREEIEAEVARLEAEWTATDYQRQRQPEYPPLADLADALYWQAQGDASKMTAYLAAIQSVKDKYPKGEE
jgi:hypothetical protein